MEGETHRKTPAQSRISKEEARMRRDLTMVIISQTKSAMEIVNSTFQGLISDLTDRVLETSVKVGRGNADQPRSSSSPQAQPITQYPSDLKDNEKFNEYIERIKFSRADEKLNVDSDFFIWLSKLKSELQAQEVLYAVDDTVPVPPNATPRGLSRLEDKVMHFIKSRICDDFQSLVMQYKTPMEMMKGLENHIVPIAKSTEYSLRIQFGNIKYEKGSETAAQFIQRYENLIRKMQRCPGIPMDEHEKKSGFVMAVRAHCEGIRVSEKIPNNEITYEMMKKILVEDELDNEESNRRDTVNDEKALTTRKRRYNESQPSFSQRSEPVCFQCGISGHTVTQCGNQGKGKMCYACHKFTKDHLAATCPTVTGRAPNTNKKRYNAKQFKGLKIKRMSNMIGPKQKLSKLALRKAVTIGQRRARNGQAALILFTDSEDDDCDPNEKVYYVDGADLHPNELNEADDHRKFSSKTQDEGSPAQNTRKYAAFARSEEDDGSTQERAYNISNCW